VTDCVDGSHDRKAKGEADTKRANCSARELVYYDCTRACKHQQEGADELGSAELNIGSVFLRIQLRVSLGW
jgi:hypothetical protein